MKHFKVIWAYRYFIISSIITEFRTKFVRSRLGAIWMIAHPLAQVAIYALVLSAVLSTKFPGVQSQYAYAVYLMAGMLAWTLFAEVFSRSLTIFIDNGNLLKKMSFPKIALPLIVFGTAIINNLLLLISILVVFGILGHPLFLSLIWLILLISLTLSLAAGLGLIAGIMNVFIRDIGQMMPIVLQFWFWLTPVVYVSSIIPEKYKYLLMLNPMSSVVMSYQDVLLYGRAPDLLTLIYPCGLALLSLFLASWIYYRANEEMADVL
ncbi:MAG: ABC transporter permease [Sulfurospirillaceae bacterium]|nr:ABC transporter permease [Sulfurospirillaceae bacterium]